MCQTSWSGWGSNQPIYNYGGGYPLPTVLPQFGQNGQIPYDSRRNGMMQMPMQQPAVNPFQQNQPATFGLNQMIENKPMVAAAPQAQTQQMTVNPWAMPQNNPYIGLYNNSVDPEIASLCSGVKYPFTATNNSVTNSWSNQFSAPQQQVIAPFIDWRAQENYANTRCMQNYQQQMAPQWPQVQQMTNVSTLGWNDVANQNWASSNIAATV